MNVWLFSFADRLLPAGHRDQRNSSVGDGLDQAAHVHVQPDCGHAHDLEDYRRPGVQDPSLHDDRVQPGDVPLHATGYLSSHDPHLCHCKGHLPKILIFWERKIFNNPCSILSLFLCVSFNASTQSPHLSAMKCQFLYDH